MERDIDIEYHVLGGGADYHGHACHEFLYLGLVLVRNGGKHLKHAIRFANGYARGGGGLDAL